MKRYEFVLAHKRDSKTKTCVVFAENASEAIEELAYLEVLGNVNLSGWTIKRCEVSHAVKPKTEV